MAISDERKAFIRDLFAEIGGISMRPMMGGQCIYSFGTIFAIISADDKIYLKAKGQLASDLAKDGAQQFEMERKDGSIGRMGYWTLPDDCLDDAERACEWGRRILSSSF